MVGVEGNIVATFAVGNVTCRISDAAYAGKSDAELERIRENARMIARGIAIRAEMRARGMVG